MPFVSMFQEKCQLKKKKDTSNCAGQLIAFFLISWQDPLSISLQLQKHFHAEVSLASGECFVANCLNKQQQTFPLKSASCSRLALQKES